MDERLRHKRAFAFFRWLLSPFIKLLLNYSCDDLGDIPGPYILLSNHNTDLDPLLIGIAAKKQLYFVASEHIMRGGLGTKFIMRYFKPIIHTKGKLGLSSTMEMLKTLKRGDSVCLFPEGNRSFNGVTGEIPAVTGKFVRRSGASLITFRLEGGYFTQPRWGLSLRRGKMHGKLVKLYSPDELKKLTDAEVNAIIANDLAEDAYALQEREHVRFSGSKLADGLESALFTCPICGKIGGLHTDHKMIFCGCGFKAVLDGFGSLTDNSGKKRSITEWDRWQRVKLLELVRSLPEKELFSDEVTVNRIGNKHTISEKLAGKLSATARGFLFNNKEIKPDTIDGAAIYSRNVLVAHVGDEPVQYEIRGVKSFCALKYLYLYDYLRTVK